MSFSSFGSWNMECAFAMSVAAILEEVVGPNADLAVTFERIFAESSEMRSDR